MINFKTITSLALAGSMLFAVTAYADHDNGRKGWRDRDEWRGWRKECRQECRHARWENACFERCKREHRRHHFWLGELNDWLDD
ncbi:MAG: hypothetical protein JSS50_00665 [Proteobacteria bacterium]|nr:hypothetical protein [Pseudomonadota bacterium]